MSSNPSHHSPQPSSNWFYANLKWLLPVGCLAMIGAFVALSALILVIIFGSMRSSWAYQEGIELASTHPDVAAVLGEPITSGWFITGSINFSGTSGNADLSIPLRGPNGRGTLYVVASRSEGEWSMDRARVQLEDQADPVVLLAGDRDESVEQRLEADDPN